MATDLQLGGAMVKEQSIWAVLGLNIVTLGIYSFFWYYRINREMRDFGQTRGDVFLANSKPEMSVVAMFVPVANLITLHNVGKRIQRVQVLAGNPMPTYSMVLHWVLILFTGLWFLYSQSALNTLWRQASANLGGGSVPIGSASNVSMTSSAPSGSPFIEPPQ